MSETKPTSAVRQIYKLHWHIMFTHFPVPLLMVTFGFQALDILLDPPGFDLATDLVFIAAAATLIPIVLTGLRTWKKDYKSAKITLFQRKIAVAWGMLVVGIPMAIERVISLVNGSTGHTAWFDLLYFVVIWLLVAGAVVEGFYGSRLNHR